MDAKLANSPRTKTPTMCPHGDALPAGGIHRRKAKSHRGSSRAGIASLLAMLFLVLIATLAVGLIAATEMSAQIAANQRRLDLARSAADSGMSFIRYQLGAMNLPAGTNSSNLLSNVATQLGVTLNGTANMGGSTVAVSNNAIYLPSQAGWVTLDSNFNTKFQIAITQSGNNLVVTCHGASQVASVLKGVQLQYQPSTGNSSILNYGIAAHGPIVVSGNATIVGASNPAQGSVFSATAQAAPLTMSGNVSISGDFSDTNAVGSLSMSGNVTIAGYTPSQAQFSQHVHKGIPMPVFPTVDTSVYLPYATNTYVAGRSSYINTIVPPNTNPSFSGNVTVQGVLYIQTPNTVTFSGNTTIQGAIVVENNPTGNSNRMTFSGNVSATAMNTLPANSTFPAAERALIGSFLLAPSFAVSFSGNFGTIGGSLVADSFTFSGNAGGTVNGSVIALKDVPFTASGNSPFEIGTPVTTTPAGITFPGPYAPVPGTYLEVH